MQELIFATNNQHKVTEVQAAIGTKIKVITLREAGITIDIPEPYDTLEENAREKSRVIHQLTGKNCFSEDTGLEIEALNGEPGVKSARYSGEDSNAEKNTAKVLSNMQHSTNRKARFRTVISLILDKENYTFEGICEGTIGTVAKGDHGFGYDPIFTPDGYSKTFAEMTMEEKGLCSHRRKASDKLVYFLQNRLNS